MKKTKFKILILLLLLFAPCLAFTQSIRSQLAKQLIAQDPSLVDIYGNRGEVERRLNVMQFDLNNDRSLEYLVSGVYCGAQNCPFYIFKRKSGHLEQIPSEIEGIFVKVLPTKSKGWKDLLFAYHSSSSREPETKFRFNGYKYVAQ